MTNETSHFLDLPNRLSKPRNTGLNILIDTGLALNYFHDVISSHGHAIDYVKFGWGTAYITTIIKDKINILQDHNIKCFLGGTFFELALQQDKLSPYLKYAEALGCNHIEISNGSIPIENTDKCKYIREINKHFIVFSEVGYKDQTRSQELHPALWIDYINQDLDAGAAKVITEARESGTSGICRSNGELRYGLIKEITHSNIDLDQLIFETPTKSLQTYFIKNFGTNVNLANINFQDIISVETLRLGLRADTLDLNIKEVIEEHV